MKSFLVFLRILIVGCLWGIVFTEGIRVIMLCNWHFDIFWPDHWRQFGRLWRTGWMPRAAKEWAFILLIVTFIPMLITGWWTLSLVKWEEIIWNIITYPYRLYKRYFGTNAVATVSPNNRYGIVKRKSYKQIRPAGISTLRVPISDYGSTAISAPMAAPSALAGSSFASSYNSTPEAVPVKKKTDVAATIDHALFKFDDDDDFDLDIDSFEKTDVNKKKQSAPLKSRRKYDDEEDDFENKPVRKKFDFDDEDEDEEDDSRSKRKDRESRETKRSNKKSDDKEKRTTRPRSNESDEDPVSEKTKRNNRNSAGKSGKDTEEFEGSRGPVYDALSQKGYDVLANVAVGDVNIDFVGASENEICFCLIDKESGDWLADEEMFNGEEPLWFSENSHRVSPVCKLSNVKKIIENKLEEEGFNQRLSFYVVIQMANIINADDMFDIWNDMNIEVTRINRGAPKEIKLFSKQLNEVGDKLTKKNLDRLLGVFKNLK